MTDTIIATGFVADEPGTDTRFPAVGRHSSSAAFQAVYWRCIAVFFASSVRHNPDARHVLFTNAEPPEVDGHSIGGLLETLGVETVHLPLSRRLPVAVYGNVFYILDIVDHCIRGLDAERYFVLDPDCLWVRPIEHLEAAVDQHGALTCARDHPETQDINGLNRRDLKAIYERFTGQARPDAPLHFGGGIFAARAAECPRIMGVADRLWADTLATLSNGGGPWLHTEEHLLSLAYLDLGYGIATANPFLDPINTAFRYNTAKASNLELTVWHLPAEKRWGFRRMFRDAMDRRSTFWRAPLGDAFRRYSARKMGIPRRSPAKFALDAAAKITQKLRRD